MSHTLPKITNLLWNIPEYFGGMTSAVLTRTELIAREGYECETLILDPLQRRAHDLERLTARGHFPASGSLLNLWDILAEQHFEAPRVTPAAWDTALPAAQNDLKDWYDADVLRVRTKTTADGSGVLQRDHYRPDGTLLVVDRHDRKKRGVPGGRRVTLFNHAGQVVQSWRSIWPLYSVMLDRHCEQRNTILFLDSKVTARFAQQYQRDHIASVHIVHGLHLSTAQQPPLAFLSKGRADIMRQLFKFDRVVCSTAAQQHDMAALVPPAPQIDVIPPAIVQVAHGEGPRDAGYGVVLASLLPGKRLHHCIEAVRLARQAVPGIDIRLDIFGTGDEYETLQAHITAAGLTEAVRLCGYRSNAKEAFANASWTAMTSTHEGFGMAIVEAMSAGCVPFAYDISYGPSGLLAPFPDHLLPAGETQALADALLGFVRKTEAERADLSARAAQKASEYAPKAITGRWVQLITELDASLPLKRAEPAATVQHALQIVRTTEGVSLSVDFGWPAGSSLPEISLGIASASPLLEWRQQARVKSLRGGRIRCETQLSVADFSAAFSAGPVTVVAVVQGEHGGRRQVLREEVPLAEMGTIRSGVRGARRVVRAVKRRLIARELRGK